MALVWCEGGCGDLVDADRFYCSDFCKQKAHRRYLHQSRETRDETRRNRPPPPAPTMSTTVGWQLFAERSADLPDNNPAVEALETRRRALAPRRDLSPPRQRPDLTPPR
jgi:hypothetical protein